ncbi:MAG: ABC transporter substrate-binding protein [Chloroflexi bacterium]|nr:ABC transporter substrate-binding protein [Chloroflexota bacterium]
MTSSDPPGRTGVRAALRLAMTLGWLALLVGCQFGTTATPTPEAPPSSTLDAIPPSAATLDGPINLTLLADLSDTDALDGAMAQQATALAADHINAQGGVNAQPIRLTVRDSASSNAGALQALELAASADNAIALIGPADSARVQSISERIADVEIPTLMAGANATLTRVGNPWLFRLRPDDGVPARAMAAWALNDLKGSRIAVLHDSSSVGIGGADLIEAALKSKGLSLIARQRYAAGARDFSAPLRLIKATGADVLCLYTSRPADGVALLQQIKKLGLRARLIGSPAYAEAAIRQLPGDLLESLTVVVDFVPGRTPEYADYARAWRARYQTEPDASSAWRWDAVHLAARVVARAGADKHRFRAELLKTKGFKGASGAFSFSADGSGRHSVDVAQYQNSVLQYVQTIDTGSQ